MFDVDGVLIDTFEIVRRAYAEVGVDLHDQRWGVAWQTWLPEYCDNDLDRARVLHDQKTEAHLDLLTRTTVNTLAGAQVADSLHSRGWTVKFLTAGTRQVVHQTFHAVNPSWLGRLAGTDLTSAGKRQMLGEISAGGGVYVDDNRDLGVAITEDSAWNLVHFRGQTEEELTTEIVEQWTR
ncbi:hypothetical protein [Saccharopolyspora phatthalungensis]|uniref:Haloacid dehalogenase n=1 Tax=Saccharopolyspora phatthalungensis TaxID=664693 RepID=A0A840QK00_9PSEU|nr:hypothetical protein [Saccharopolyspora phatthalungensis]MBB5159609.1 hypothetical protein [Saccharopolyspora phatthalungensis]